MSAYSHDPIPQGTPWTCPDCGATFDFLSAARAHWEYATDCAAVEEPEVEGDESEESEDAIPSPSLPDFQNSSRLGGARYGSIGAIAEAADTFKPTTFRGVAC